MSKAPLCPLCGNPEISHYHTDKQRSYLLCQKCKLVFVAPEQRISSAMEKAQYDLHNNDPDDPGYRRFLARLAGPVSERVTPGCAGLDFGSGPGPTLSLMLQELGYRMNIYDPFYAADSSVLDGHYDFITSTEAIEHFHHPAKEWQLWMKMLRPGGVLGIMTKLRLDYEAFCKWHYKLDPTHVSFFSRETFRYLAEQYQLKVEFIGNDVVILNKTDTGIL